MGDEALAVTGDRDRLHDLVDRLSEEDIDVARELLERLAVRTRKEPGREQRLEEEGFEELLDEMEPYLEGLPAFSDRVKSGYKPK
jgi:hypothetical protein